MVARERPPRSVGLIYLCGGAGRSRPTLKNGYATSPILRGTPSDPLLKQSGKGKRILIANPLSDRFDLVIGRAQKPLRLLDAQKG